MELIKLGVRGYRRFRDQYEMDVDDKLIAIAGPNEAGKTSFLEGVARHLDANESEFEPRERTRGAEHPQTEISARFVLTADEQTTLVDEVPEARMSESSWNFDGDPELTITR